MRSRLGWSPLSLVVLLLLASCAGPEQLAKISDRQLHEGHIREAYDTARRAVDKNRLSAPARRAMTAAATRSVEDWQQRVLTIAQADTVAAARYSIELRDFRTELDQYPITVPVDSGYTAQATRIRDAAAGIEYRRGDAAFRDHHPKAAYARFRAAAEIVSGYRDVQSRIQKSHDAATTRVAIVPFANETDVPNLSKGFADAMYGEIAPRVESSDFVFTELVDRDEVYASMTVKELEKLNRDGALRIGQGIDADRVVTGRLHGMRASSNFKSFDRPIFRKVVERDTSGKERVRYVETRFTGVSRERWVTVHCDFDILDTRTGEVVATRSDALEADARVAWTDFRAEGDCGAYCLVPPDVRRNDPVRAKEVEDSWHETFGSWRLPDLLERSRKDRRRATYQAGYRDEFRNASHDHPILLGELPDEDDLAYVALDGAWEKVLAVLRELDPQD